MITKAEIVDILRVEMQAHKDKKTHAVWQPVMTQGHPFIQFLPDHNVPSGSTMGIEGLQNTAALKWKPMQDGQEPKSFCPRCHKFGRKTIIIMNHLCQEHYKLAVRCRRCCRFLAIQHEDIRPHFKTCK